MDGMNIPIGGDMTPFLAVMGQLRAEMQNVRKHVRSGFRPAKREGNIFVRAMRGSFKSVVSSARAAGRMIRNALKLPSKIFKMPMLPLAGLIGGIGVATLAVSQFKDGLNIAGEFERIDISLQTLTGSSKKANAVMQEMKRTWLETGVAVADQSSTIRKFIALGFSPDDAVKLQKNILDVAGAVGMTSKEANLLGSALAQVKAKGVVSMEELRQQIAEKGVPVFEELAAKIGVTQGELIDMVSKGKVPAQELIDIFLNMEGGFAKFSGGAQRLGMTFSGMVSRLKGAWALFKAEFAAPITDALKPLLDAAIGKIAELREIARSAGEVIGKTLLVAFSLIQSGRLMDVVRVGLGVAIAAGMDLLMRGLRGAVAFLSTAIPPVFSAAVSVLKDPNLWRGIATILVGVGDGLAARLKSSFFGFTRDFKRENIEKAIGHYKEQIANEQGDGFRKQKLEEALARAEASLVELDKGDPHLQAIANAQKTQDQGIDLIGKAGSGINMAETLANSLTAGMKASKNELMAPMSEALREMLSRWKELSAEQKDAVAQLVEKFKPEEPGDMGDARSGRGAFAGGPQMKNSATLTTSLGRIGGGGFGMTFLPMVTEAKKGNALLTKIEKNTRNAGAAVPVVA